MLTPCWPQRARTVSWPRVENRRPAHTLAPRAHDGAACSSRHEQNRSAAIGQVARRRREARLRQPADRSQLQNDFFGLCGLGAVLGPLAACGLLTWLGEAPDTYRVLFWVAFVPALLSIGLLSLMKVEQAS